MLQILVLSTYKIYLTYIYLYILNIQVYDNLFKCILLFYFVVYKLYLYIILIHYIIKLLLK